VDAFAADDEVVHGDGVLVVSGEIDLACVDDVLARGLALLAQPQVRGLVIDLAQVSFIDSCGLSVLVRLHHAARASSKQVALRHPSRIVARLLQQP
jgi:anti-sigma B factor antagonist